MRIRDFFSEILGARLWHWRWSWGAADENRQVVFLTVWRDEFSRQCGRDRAAAFSGTPESGGLGFHPCARGWPSSMRTPIRVNDDIATTHMLHAPYCWRPNSAPCNQMHPLARE
jgi:hypothetical protein